MDSLFENFVNTKPLRKMEPLIRYDIEGKPQPRRLMEDIAKPIKPNPPPPPPPQELKRSHDPPAPEIEPKRKQAKQTKQTSIISFFKKQ